MNRTYKILRRTLMWLLIVLSVIIAGLYISLSLPSVQDAAADRIGRWLSDKTGMRVDIGGLYIQPFNRVTLREVSIADSIGPDTVLTVRRLGAGINVFDLIVKRRTVINYVELIGADIRLRRDSASAPLNIQPLIDAFKSSDPDKPPTPYDLRFNTAIIRTSRLSYDVGLDTIHDGSRLDPNHIVIDGLRADITIPRLSNDHTVIDMRRLAFDAPLILESLSLKLTLKPDATALSDFTIDMPGTHLAFNPVSLPCDITHASDCLREGIDIPIALESGCHITPSDLSYILPVLEHVRGTYYPTLRATLSRNALDVEDMSLSNESGSLSISGAGSIAGSMTADSVDADIKRLFVRATPGELYAAFDGWNPQASNIIDHMGRMELSARGSLMHGIGECEFNITSALIDAKGSAAGKFAHNTLTTEGSLTIADMDIPRLTWPGAIPPVQARGIEAQWMLNGPLKALNGDARFSAPSAVADGRVIENLALVATMTDGMADVELSCESGSTHLSLNGLVNPLEPRFDGHISIADFAPARLGLGNALGACSLTLDGEINMGGSSLNELSGFVGIDNILLSDSTRNVSLGALHIDATPDSTSQHLTLTSRLLDAKADGRFSIAALIDRGRHIASAILPSLCADAGTSVDETCDLKMSVTIKDTEPLEIIRPLPVRVIYPVSLNLMADSLHILANLDAPYLQQGNKLIENTRLTLTSAPDSTQRQRAIMEFGTSMPSKHGTVDLHLAATAVDDTVQTDLGWVFPETGFSSGSLELMGTFERDPMGLRTSIDLLQSELALKDTVWTLDQSHISIMKDLVEVSGFRLGRTGQYMAIDGIATSSAESGSLDIILKDIDLDYIFESLGIEAAMFGGRANGTFYASGLLSAEPRVFTPALHVANLTYNHSLMGDAVLTSAWDNDRRAVTIKADIAQPNGRHSKVDGAIMPLTEELDFRFSADRIEVGFMLPYMQAFTSRVSGYATGNARLYGTFKLIDMVGDIYAEDFKMKIDFTNTVYSTTDSLHLTPGRINLENITLYDAYGRTAMLNGYVAHEFFKRPRFVFNITDAHDFLVYDMPENADTNWYGRIFGNGGAKVRGVPGHIDIGVNISTAAGSAFTFVLSDAEQAEDLTFLTFRDSTPREIKAQTAEMAVVQSLRERMKAKAEDSQPTIYNIDVDVDVNPSAAINLVMDPIGGDKIKAFGSGNMRMTYSSADEDLRLFGTYTLDRGSYNFTLQDIIIKDFSIRRGSSITFTGDPYAGRLDINAVYQLNANLSDLDESFLQDKEVARTNVPVRAILNVNGDMRQPDVSFDLEFPTLTSDTYRKVRSIISTDEMMNRQIIYLLALNRFYTPDYTQATKGNELVSVASSTISSQLSNILGQLSDNWTISPNIRSDRGDFSDVEFDLALSSHLLNNRLLLNGNFGYRDKSMNTNAFIGDFDLEYLLNRSGTIRLKAYNRYNDRNFYFKSALTTQGVGVMFRRDFDNMFSFLRRKHKTPVVKPDSTATIDTAIITDEVIIVEP